MRWVALLVVTSVLSFAARRSSAGPGDDLVGEWTNGKESFAILRINGVLSTNDNSSSSLWVELTNTKDLNYEAKVAQRIFRTYRRQGDTLRVRTVVADKSGATDETTYRRIPFGVKPGRYRMDLVVEILSSNKGGRWDPMGDPPDPIVTVVFRGPEKPRSTSCRQKDTFSSQCLNGTVIDVDANTFLEVRLEDEDAIRNDWIATINPVWIASSVNKPSKPITMRATDGSQIKSATLTLTPVNKF